jgi:hypothetical protein
MEDVQEMHRERDNNTALTSTIARTSQPAPMAFSEPTPPKIPRFTPLTAKEMAMAPKIEIYSTKVLYQVLSD